MKFAALFALCYSAAFAQTDSSAELDRAKKTLQDWPALSRYADDNAKLTTPAW
jgi:hypothetical protein